MPDCGVVTMSAVSYWNGNQVIRLYEPDAAKIAGLQALEEQLHEDISELGWMLAGPESYDKDQREDLKAEGQWEAEMERWKKDRPNYAPDEQLELIDRVLQYTISLTRYQMEVEYCRLKKYKLTQERPTLGALKR